MQQDYWSALKIIPESSTINYVMQNSALKGHFMSAATASDMLPFQLQGQPPSHGVFASAATSVCLKCHSVARHFGGSEEQSGLPCHLSSQCGGGSGEGQAERWVPMRWQNPYFTRRWPQKNQLMCRAAFQRRWTQIQGDWVAVWLNWLQSCSVCAQIAGC